MVFMEMNLTIKLTTSLVINDRLKSYPNDNRRWFIPNSSPLNKLLKLPYAP